MGDVIRLETYRARREGCAPRSPARVEFLFDLTCPFSYFAAERIERAFDQVTWRPASGAALRQGAAGDGDHDARVRAVAERRAAELRLPLVWPESWPAEVPAAMRAAAHAAGAGRGAAFALAAARLAFCGGFELDDPDVLVEAAAAAGLGLEACLTAARDVARDAPIDAAGRRLLAAGADCLPALRVGRALFWGEHRVGAAALAAREREQTIAPAAQRGG